MHNPELMSKVICNIETVVQKKQASKVVAAKVKLGQLIHMSPEAFRENFEKASRGTVVEGARLDVEKAKTWQDFMHSDSVLVHLEYVN